MTKSEQKAAKSAMIPITKSNSDILYLKTNANLRLRFKVCRLRKGMVIMMRIHKLKIREKAARGTALILIAALIFTGIDLTVFATDGERIKTQEVITGFGWTNRSQSSYCRWGHRKAKSFFRIPLR